MVLNDRDPNEPGSDYINANIIMVVSAVMVNSRHPQGYTHMHTHAHTHVDLWMNRMWVCVGLLLLPSQLDLNMVLQSNQK